MALPNECWFLILTHLSLNCKLRMRRVCQSWFELTKNINQRQKILTVWNEFVGDVDNYRMYRTRHNGHLLDIEKLTADKSKRFKNLYPNLTQIHICNIKASLGALQELFTAYPQLERVSLYKVKEIDQGLDSVLHLLPKSCPQLKYLQIIIDPDDNTPDLVLHGPALLKLRELKSLEGLHLRVHLVGPSSYEFLREMKSLKVLKARRQTMDFAPFVQCLEHCGSQLSELAIKLESEDAERFLEAITRLSASSLKLFLLKYEVTDREHGEVLGLVHVQQICKLQNLVSLVLHVDAHFASETLTDSCLERIMQSCKSIRSFGVQYVGRGVTEKTTQNLVTYWPELLSLEMEVFRVDDNWLRELKKLKQLHFLAIPWTKASNCMAEIVKESSTLRTLMVRIDVSSPAETTLVENILDIWDKQKRPGLLHILAKGSPAEIDAGSGTYIRVVKVPETVNNERYLTNMQKFLLQDMFVFPRTC